MVMNKLYTIIFFLAVFNSLTYAQFPGKYFVKFSDKNGSIYSVSNPSAFLSAKSVLRRNIQNIPIHTSDLPVNETYVSQIQSTGANVLQRSKWLNGVIVVINNPTQYNAINNLSFVVSNNQINKPLKSIERDEVIEYIPKSQSQKNNFSSTYAYGPSLTQISQIGLDCMHNAGLRGNNMLIGVIDSGFEQVNINPVFDSLKNENRIIGTRDIVAGNSSVYEDHNHGAMVLSCISGNSPGNLIGTAPKSKVYLIRSEDVFSEKIIEEYNWVVAAELADSIGADIITTSLGYTTFDNPSQNHTYADLNGKTSVMSVGSTMAARKGIIVLNAAGNEGAGSWGFIAVPADADSIFSVGAVNSSGLKAGFSSFGPTSDGRIKPDICTMGEGAYVCAPGYNFFAGNGTSFACPIMAGAVACLWQAHPTKTNFQIMQAIKSTASKSANPDNQLGWGIPNICAAHQFLSLPTAISQVDKITFEIFPNPTNSFININIDGEIDDLLVTDVLGKLQCAQYNLNQSFATISLSELPDGIYFLQLKTNDGLYLSQKIVKE
jgi:subtilisin family serine protease